MFSHRLTFAPVRTLALLAGAAGTAPLFAADPPQVAQVAISDVTLARAVLAAFDADPVLRDAQLLVSVVDRGAVIAGPVPTDEVRKRAEAVARGVPGVGAVRTVCYLEADPDPLLRAVAARPRPAAVALPGLAPPPAAPDGFIPVTVPPAPPIELSAARPGNTVVAQRPDLSAPTIALGPPVIARATVPPAPTSGATAPGHLAAATGARANDILTAVAAIRAREPRYARLNAELKPDGALFVTGTAAHPDDARAFVRELQKVPGVAFVAIDPRTVK